MRVHTAHLEVQTRGKGTYEITRDLEKVIADTKIETGTATVFVRHTSCSLIIMENAAPDARRDLEKFFDDLVPEDTPYFQHAGEGGDDMPSHIRMVLTHTSEVVPIVNARMQLGTWQGIFLFEHRRAAHTRKVMVTVLGE
jgi:secondary thiamine-phosphate synthase enzyme